MQSTLWRQQAERRVEDVRRGLRGMRIGGLDKAIKVRSLLTPTRSLLTLTRSLLTLSRSLLTLTRSH